MAIEASHTTLAMVVKWTGCIYAPVALNITATALTCSLAALWPTRHWRLMDDRVWVYSYFLVVVFLAV